MYRGIRAIARDPIPLPSMVNSFLSECKERSPKPAHPAATVMQTSPHAAVPPNHVLAVDLIAGHGRPECAPDSYYKEEHVDYRTALDPWAEGSMLP